MYRFKSRRSAIIVVTVALLALGGTGAGIAAIMSARSGDEPPGAARVEVIDGRPAQVCGTDDGTGCAPESDRVDLAAPVFSDPTNITNPLFPISRQYSVILLGISDGVPLRVEVTLLPRTKSIGLDGTVVEALESQYVAYLDGRIHELALDWYAQANDGSVWYLGEDVFNYEDGEVADTDGTWLASRDGPAAMIMPANPEVGDVYRPENIPGLVFEEVVVKSNAVTVEGPLGPVPGSIVVLELHMDGSTEEKSFAPGYGEFSTGSGANLEAVAIAVPEDARGQPVPNGLLTLMTGAYGVLDAVGAGDWATTATTVAVMDDAWADLVKDRLARKLVAQMTAALASLTAAAGATDAAATSQAALNVAQASLDLQLHFRLPAEIDRARFGLWVRQLQMDVDEGDLAAIVGDSNTLSLVLDRFVHTLPDKMANDIRGLLRDLSAAAGRADFGGVAAITERLGGF